MPSLKRSCVPVMQFRTPAPQQAAARTRAPADPREAGTIGQQCRQQDRIHSSDRLRDADLSTDQSVIHTGRANCPLGSQTRHPGLKFFLHLPWPLVSRGICVSDLSTQRLGLDGPQRLAEGGGKVKASARHPSP